MACSTKLDMEIDCLKKQLVATAAAYKYNLHHPQVIEISQKLDKLIVKQMKQIAAS